VLWNHVPNQSLDRRTSRWSRFATPRCYPNHSTTQEIVMTLTAEHLSPIVALIAGILILILPSLLNYVVAIYLIVTGLIGLNGIYHFVN
jgi:Protein of unknown function (DUF3096)